MVVEKQNLSTRDKIIDWTFFAILLLLFSGVTLWLFHQQTLGSPERYHSDMKAYILKMQGLDSGYSFPYPILFKLGAFFYLFTTPEFAMALATMVLNSGAVVITKIALNRLSLEGLQRAWRERREAAGKRNLCLWAPGMFISILSVLLFLISMIYPPDGIYLPGIRFKYLGVFTPNPFHNATYMAARPFAILAFLWLAKLLPEYEKGAEKKDYFLFSLFLLLATMAKPSFTIVLVGTAGLIMLYRLIRRRFKNFVPSVWMGITFVPTFLDLLYQFKGVFVPREGAEGGIGFCLGDVWRQYCGNLPLAIGLAVGFPLLVLLCNWRELKQDSLYRLSWQLYLMSFAMAFFLYEKGFRKPDFNFSWGYMYGIFFCHMGALLVLLKATAGAGGQKNKPVVIALQWLAFFCHVVCGLLYFKNFLGGGMYY